MEQQQQGVIWLWDASVLFIGKNQTVKDITSQLNQSARIFWIENWHLALYLQKKAINVVKQLVLTMTYQQVQSSFDLLRKDRKLKK